MHSGECLITISGVKESWALLYTNTRSYQVAESWEVEDLYHSQYPPLDLCVRTCSMGKASNGGL